ncbi:MAG TPA: hypothetical protein VK880_00590 [Anaerolineales bacterium]|nr:hypothetical protein [Anaerolineales bacterium]
MYFILHAKRSAVILDPKPGWEVVAIPHGHFDTASPVSTSLAGLLAGNLWQKLMSMA